MLKSYKAYLKDISTFIFDIDGVLTDGSVLITTKGEQLRKMSISDGYALKTALQEGYYVCAISGGNNPGVKERLRDLGVTDIYLGVRHKEEQLLTYLEINEIRPDNVMYMGDDIPDIPAMQQVALPACPQNAAPEVKAISKYVSHKSGGEGCVRDIIEQVLKVRGDWNGNFDAKD
jgi:3-deoxy-D-manno-octulosonate 8-phosphate phosphatase (KDO 8-P phosphatase)